MTEALNHKANTPGIHNIFRLATLLMQEGECVLINLLCALGKHSKRIDSAGEEKYPRCGKKGEPFPLRGDIPESLEITSMSSLFKALRGTRNLPKLKKEPEDNDLSLSADIARIQVYRNEIYTLVNKKISEFTEDKYEELYEKIMSALTRIVKDYSGTNFDAVTIWEEKVANYRTAPITEEDKRNLEELYRWYLNDLEEEKTQSSETRTDEYDVEFKVNHTENETEEISARTTSIIEGYNKDKADRFGCHHLVKEKEMTKIGEMFTGHKMEGDILLWVQGDVQEGKGFGFSNSFALKHTANLSIYQWMEAQDFGQYEEAFKLLNCISQILSPNSELCSLVTRNNIGCFAFILGKVSTAQVMFNVSLQLTNCGIQMLVKNDQSAVILKSLLFVLKNNFAFVELEKGNFVEALILFKSLFEEERKSAIEDIDFRDNEQSRDADATSRDSREEELGEQCESLLIILGPSSGYRYSRKNLKLASVALNYSRACLLAGRIENIVEDLQHVLYKCQFLKAEFPLQTMIGVRLARILTLLGKIKEADEVIELRGIDSLKIQKMIENDSLKPFSGMFTEDISHVLAYRGERAKSRELLHTAIRVCQDKYNKNNPMTVSLEKTTKELFPTLVSDEDWLAVNSTTETAVSSLKFVIFISIDYAMRGIKVVCDHTSLLRELDVMKEMASGALNRFTDWHVFVKQVSASAVQSPEFVLIRTFCICFAFLSQQVEATEIAEACLENQLDTITSLHDFLNDTTSVSKTGLSFLSDYESCIMSSLCFLLETALLRQFQTIANNICKSLASYLSSQRKEDAKNAQWYKDYCGVLSSFVSTEQVQVSGNNTLLFIIVTCGLNRSESLGVHPENEAFFRRVKIDSKPEECSTPQETRLQWFVYFRSRDLLDINELRQISKNIVESFQSWESLSIKVRHQGDQFIEVIQGIHQAELSNVYLQVRLLRNCWAHCAEPVYPCPIKARSRNEFFLWKIQKEMTFKESDAGAFISVFQHTLRDMRLVDVLQESMKTWVCQFKIHPFSLLTLHTKTSITYLTLHFVTDSCSRDGTVTNDTTKLLDDVIEDCSEKLTIWPSNKPGNAWYRVTDVESDQSTNPVLDGAEEDDDLEKAMKANDRLTAEVEHLKSKTSELSARLRSLHEQLLEMEGRAFLLHHHFVQSVCSNKDTMNVVENWIVRRKKATGDEETKNHEPPNQDRISNLEKYLDSMSNDELAQLLVDIQRSSSDQPNEKTHESFDSFRSFQTKIGIIEGERAEGAVGTENQQQSYFDVAVSKNSSHLTSWWFPPAVSTCDFSRLKRVTEKILPISSEQYTQTDSLSLVNVNDSQDAIIQTDPAVPTLKETFEKGLADFERDRAERLLRKSRLLYDVLALKYRSRETAPRSEDFRSCKTSSQKEDDFGTLKEQEMKVRDAISGVCSIGKSKRVILGNGNTIQESTRTDKTWPNIRESSNEEDSIGTSRQLVASSVVLPPQNSTVSETSAQDVKAVFRKEIFLKYVSTSLPFLRKQETEITEIESSGSEKTMNESSHMSEFRESKRATTEQRNEDNKFSDATTPNSETWPNIKHKSGNEKDSIGTLRQSMASSFEMTHLPTQTSVKSETSVQDKKDVSSFETFKNTDLPKEDTYITELERSGSEQRLFGLSSDISTKREPERVILDDRRHEYKSQHSALPNGKTTSIQQESADKIAEMNTRYTHHALLFTKEAFLAQDSTENMTDVDVHKLSGNQGTLNENLGSQNDQKGKHFDETVRRHVGTQIRKLRATNELQESKKDNGNIKFCRVRTIGEQSSTPINRDIDNNKREDFESCNNETTEIPKKCLQTNKAERTSETRVNHRECVKRSYDNDDYGVARTGLFEYVESDGDVALRKSESLEKEKLPYGTSSEPDGVPSSMQACDEERVCDDLTPREPVCDDLTPREPLCDDLTPREPVCDEVTPREPECNDGTPREPVCDDVTPREPVCDDVTPREPVCDEVTPREPVCDEVTPREPVCDDVTPREPVCDEVTPRDPFCDDVSPREPLCDDVTPREPVCDDVTSKKVACGDTVMSNALESTSNHTVMEAAAASFPSPLIDQIIPSISNEYDKQGYTCQDNSRLEKNKLNRIPIQGHPEYKHDIDDIRGSLNVIRETDDSEESAMDWNSQGARPKSSKREHLIGESSAFIVYGLESSFLARHSDDFSLTGGLPSRTGTDHRPFLSLPVGSEGTGLRSPLRTWPRLERDNHETLLTIHGDSLSTNNLKETIRSLHHDNNCRQKDLAGSQYTVEDGSYGEPMRIGYSDQLGISRSKLVHEHGNNLKMSMSSNESKQDENIEHTTNEKELIVDKNGHVSLRQSVGTFDQTVESHSSVSNNEFHLPLMSNLQSSPPLVIGEITTTFPNLVPTPQSSSPCSIESYATADSSIQSLEDQVEKMKMTCSQIGENMFIEENLGEQKLDEQELDEQHTEQEHQLENKEETETRASLAQKRCEQYMQWDNTEIGNRSNEITTQSGVAMVTMGSSVILAERFETAEKEKRETNEGRVNLPSHRNDFTHESGVRTTKHTDDKSMSLLPQRVPVVTFDETLRDVVRANEREREKHRRKEREENERRLQELRERKEQNPPSSPQPARLPVQESTAEWPCNHYKRKCEVRFPCCGQFYSCHRCHNTSGQCTKENNKALDATHLRCLMCNTEQEIKEDSHHCKNCNIQLSEYFCGICKHFTGMERTPYHCKPCGICRIHRDKSFHCDVCNVCLDERLRGKHKCRPDSGHDECCICLEDAFGGCQVLPCSHKVHRDCAVAMIRNGVRKCPVCRSPLSMSQ